MNSRIDERLLASFRNGVISDEVLASLAGGSAVAEHSPALPLSREARARQCADLLIHSLADKTLSGASGAASAASGFRSLFAFDGGLEISFFGRWRVLPNTKDSFVKVLQSAKKQAVESSAAVPLSIGERLFFLLPTGARFSFGSYTYVLIFQENNRVKYRIYIHTKPSDSIPAVRVKAEYQAFRPGSTLPDVNQEIHDILDSFALALDRETLSRIDFNCTIDRPIDDFVEAVNSDRVINRCRDIHMVRQKNGSFSSYRIGSLNSIEFAVYDKYKELTDRYDRDKIEDLAVMFDGKDDVSMTRYEWRLGRVFLHSLGIDSIEQFLDQLYDIVSYLTYNWFCVVAKREKNDRHKNRQKLAQFWSIIRYSILLSVCTNKYCTYLEEDKEVTSADNMQVKSDADIKHYQTLLKNVNRRTLKRFTEPRKLRTTLKKLTALSCGFLASAVFYSLPSNTFLTRDEFISEVKASVSSQLDETYERFCQRFGKIAGVPIAYDKFTDPVKDSQPETLFEAAWGA